MKNRNDEMIEAFEIASGEKPAKVPTASELCAAIVESSTRLAALIEAHDSTFKKPRSEEG